MTLRITPARKELLQAIADGRVCEVYNIGTGWAADLDRGPEWVSRPGARRYITVTGRVRDLYDAGLVEVEPRGLRSSYEDRRYSLTQLGMTTLDAIGGTP